MIKPKAAVFAAACALACIGFLALGVWQLERRVWKLDLIARVDARVHASPTAAPGMSDWPDFHVAQEEYRHVEVTGHYLFGRDTLVRASTELGPGYWVMSPLQDAQGAVYLVNRGFVESNRDIQAPPSADPITVTGLLRASEPGGLLLQANDAARERWVSRDVAAIAKARGLDRVAPFFLDEDAAAKGNAVGNTAGRDPSTPIAGLTVVQFRNSHLEYALTWFGLALLAAWAVVRALAPDPEKRDAKHG